MAFNILLLIADQLRADCVGYANRYPVQTPNIDRLSRQSAVYAQAYTAMPICAPMRQALMTGRNPNRFGAITNHDITATPLLRPEDTWTFRLRQRGYTGALVGNLHAPYDCEIRDFGFDHFDDRQDYFADIAGRYPDLNYKNGFFGEKSLLPHEDSMSRWISECTCGNIREFAAQDKPWFIWTEFLDPHLPCRPSEPFASMYAPETLSCWDGFNDTFKDKPYMQRQQSMNWGMLERSWKETAPTMANYFAMISQLDHAVGEILDCLDETGQAENTIVVFLSDHGDMCGSHHMMDKGYVMYDDVVHVPMMVRRPGQKAFIAEQFVSSILDLTRTIYEWTGISVPEIMDGSILPEKPDSDNGRRYITSAYNGQQFGLYSQRMLRDRRYKYVWNACDIDELYDLEQDPGELNNLIFEPVYAERISDMRRCLYYTMRDQGDFLFSHDWLRGQLLEGRKA